jgi:O-antigen/teichoic acid export membrane protein
MVAIDGSALPDEGHRACPICKSIHHPICETRGAVTRNVVSDARVPSAPGSVLRVRGVASAFTDYVSVLSARFSSVVLSLVTIAMSSRILGPTGYATIAYVAVLSGLVFAITSAWTAAAVSRYGREELETGGEVSSVTWARFVIAAPLLVLCAIVIAGLELAGALPPELTWSYAALAYACGIFLVTAEHMICVVEVNGRMKLSAVWIVVGQLLVGAGLAIILISGVSKTPLTVVALIAGSQLLVTVALAAQSRSALWPPVLHRSILRRIITFSLP